MLLKTRQCQSEIHCNQGVLQIIQNNSVNSRPNAERPPDQNLVIPQESIGIQLESTNLNGQILIISLITIDLHLID